MVMCLFGKSAQSLGAIDMQALERQPHYHGRRSVAGFTLIELLIAISLLALLSVMTWRGIDGIGQTRARLQSHGDAVQSLQVTLGQWAADLDALAEQPNWNSLQWDGRVLRLLRRGLDERGDGLRVVAWMRRGVGTTGQWWRWQSGALTTRAELDLAWQQAQIWSQMPDQDAGQQAVATIALEDWQLFFYRGNAWTNALSSADVAADTGSAATPATTAATTPQAALPEGVRLVLKLPNGQSISGVLTRDWARPLLGGAS